MNRIQMMADFAHYFIMERLSKMGVTVTQADPDAGKEFGEKWREVKFIMNSDTYSLCADHLIPAAWALADTIADPIIAPDSLPENPAVVAYLVARNPHIISYPNLKPYPALTNHDENESFVLTRDLFTLRVSLFKECGRDICAIDVVYDVA